MSTVAYPHVEFRPDGVPVITGTGHKIRLLAEAHLEGMSVEALLDAYPHLTAADIHGALTYYYDHKDEIDREIAEGRRFVEQMMAEAGESILDKSLRTMSDEELQALDESLSHPTEDSYFRQRLRELGRKLR